jgi:hypothetical protein
MRNVLIVFSGHSGVGKGTIAKLITERNKNVSLSISCTTRKPRDGETHGKEYFFISKDEFSSKIGENGFLEYSEHFENFYGTPKDFVLEKGLSEITVLSLGDMIQGMLRTSDLKLNEKDVVDAFVIAERLLAGFLNSLSKYCKVKFIQVCYSNHEQPRYLGTKANELAGEDMGKILFAYLQDVLALNERVEIIGDTEKDYYEFKIFDFECFAEHGHQIKSIADANKNLTNRHRKFYDYVFLAHSHSTKEFITAEGLHHDVETLVLPSLIGSDPYADKLMVGSKAAIKIFGFDKKYGHTESYKFILN